MKWFVWLGLLHYAKRREDLQPKARRAKSTCKCNSCNKGAACKKSTCTCTGH